MAVSTSVIKYVQSLRNKKFRQKYLQFVVEGDKAVKEVLSSDWKVIECFHTSAFSHPSKSVAGTLVSRTEMERLSHHQAPQNALVVIEIPRYEKGLPESGLHLYLDGIRDPGNLGTIVRIADWYGLNRVWCSPDTVDVFNPKCIDASMGSFLRIPVLTAEADEFFSACKLSAFAAVMEGQNIHTAQLPADAVLVIGNEGHGISKAVLDRVAGRLMIPNFGRAESLNAAIATAVILDNFRRDA